MRFPRTAALFLLLSALAPQAGRGEPVLPEPPTLAFIHDQDLPPGPALPIIEYLNPRAPGSPSPAARPDSGSPRTSSSNSAASVPAAERAPAATSPREERAAHAAPAPVTETAPRAAAANPTPDERSSEPVDDSIGTAEPELYARPDEPFSIALAGSSWLFTGAVPDSTGIEYRGRTRESGSVRFSFIVSDTGLRGLDFMRGGSSGGTPERRRIVIEIVDEERFRELVGAGDDERGGVSADDDGSADSEEGSAGPEPEDPAELLALAYSEALAGRGGEALFLVYDQRLEAAIPPAKLVAARMVISALENFDAPRLYETARSWDAADRLRLSSALLEGVARFDRARQIDLLETLRHRLSDFTGGDAFLFRLAGLYEEPGPERDIGAAVELYERILSEYPLSGYWDAARERKVYLERHFLLVR